LRLAANRRIAAAIVVGLLLLGAIHYRALDGIDGAVLAVLLRADTRYAAGYSDTAFRSIAKGMSEEDVHSRLGRPLVEVWSHTSGTQCHQVIVEQDRVSRSISEDCRRRGVELGFPADNIRKMLGTPLAVTWLYSDSPSNTHYRERVIRFEGARVSSVRSGLYLD
jgi:hypothetical protein